MGLTKEHYNLIREHFILILGSECNNCSSKVHLEFHHIIPLLTDSGRGRVKRMWEWFKAYENNNLLLCNNCHRKLHSKDSK